MNGMVRMVCPDGVEVMDGKGSHRSAGGFITVPAHLVPQIQALGGQLAPPASVPAADGDDGEKLAIAKVGDLTKIQEGVRRLTTPPPVAALEPGALGEGTDEELAKEAEAADVAHLAPELADLYRQARETGMTHAEAMEFVKPPATP